MLYPPSCELYPSSCPRAFKNKFEFLHVLLHYKAVSPLTDEICIYWGIFWWNLHLLRNLPFERSLLIRKLLKSSSWAEEFGYQIHKFLPEIKFVSNSPQLNSTLNFRIWKGKQSISYTDLANCSPQELIHPSQGQVEYLYYKALS